MASKDSESAVFYELHGPVAVIGLNRPGKRNAINDQLIDAIAAAVERASSEARAGVLHGLGKHFSAGLDLGEHVQKPPMETVKVSRRWHQVFGQIERGTIPIVAALHGAVVGGGFELASAAHIRVAEASAYFAMPEGQRGIFVGGGGAVRIARLIGAARMGDMMLTGRIVAAEEMERWGGVSYLVPQGEALAKAIEVATAAAGNAEMANYSILNALSRIQDMSSEDGLFLESIMSALTTVTPEAKEGLRAFLEKRVARLDAPDHDQQR